MGFKTILLIDDDPDDHELFIEAVQQISNTTTCISLTSAILALQKLKSKELNPDVIFLDLNMPVMSGQEFLTQIKETENIKDIPVIIYSTTSQRKIMDLTKQLGAIYFITKPSTFGDLVKVLTPIVCQ